MMTICNGKIGKDDVLVRWTTQKQPNTADMIQCKDKQLNLLTHGRRTAVGEGFVRPLTHKHPSLFIPETLHNFVVQLLELTGELENTP